MRDGDEFGRDPALRVSVLIPDGQTIVGVSPDDPVSMALTLMSEHGFSQLPVFVEGGVIGTITQKSFCYFLSISESKRPLLMPVFAFMVEKDVRFFPMDTHYLKVIDVLLEDGVIYVGEPKDLLGVVTLADALAILSDASRLFLLIKECELNLRRLLRLAFDSEAELGLYAHRVLAPVYEAEARPIPTTLEEMSLGNLRSLVEFAAKHGPRGINDVFGSLSYSLPHLIPLTAIRNDLMHFRNTVPADHRRKLEKSRMWLEMRVTVALRHGP